MADLTRTLRCRSVLAPTAFDLPVHPILQRIYAHRGIATSAELARSSQQLLPFQQLKDIDKAVALLVHARAHQQKILIVGDFDADGATSTATLMLGLNMLGLTQVDYLVPNRFDYGYGLSPELAALILTNPVDLVITVDNGIAAYDGIALLKQAGIKVLVTDHHLAGAQLPDADAIVNPNQPGCSFASKAIAGVGVVFYLLMALRAELRQQQAFVSGAEPNLASLLDLVALGTVADVVPLDTNNRILVYQGLQRIRAGHVRPGIQALIDIAQRKAERLQATDFGFALAPRLNAAGRLDDMSLGIACLLAPDVAKARRLAAELDSLNLERRDIEQSMQTEAMAVLQRLQLQQQGQLPSCLCLYQHDWHQGVIGILAGRIKERYHRPVLVFAQGDDGDFKGSARSVHGVHIRDLLEEVNRCAPGAIKKFGGHAMAAGLTVAANQFQRFEQTLNEVAARCIDAEYLTSELLTDGELAAQDINLDVAALLQNAGPWGQAFPEPIFSGEFALLQQRLVGGKHLKMMLQLAHGALVDAICFNVDLKQWPNPAATKVRLAYQLDINEFRDQTSLQLLVRYVEAVPA
jgi:single-stranded-DNA-specific exonuclease